MWKRLTTAGREERLLELLLRVGVAGCFIGHGAFGVIGKEAWLPYFAVAGIGEEWAWRLMPIVGTIDIAIGIATLVAPRAIFLVYAAVWATWTALLRPLAGESVFETLERAGNYGVPIAFLLLAGASFKPTVKWLDGVVVSRMSATRRRDVMIALRATTAVLLAGHGGLALLGKPLLLSHAQAVGLPEGTLALVGAFELALAGAVAIRPIGPLLLFVIGWKLCTEGLYPLTGDPFWEFVERAGSYVAPLALWTMVRSSWRVPVNVRRDAARVAAAGCLALLLSASTYTAHADARVATRDGELLDRLRAGGHVLACRHAITDRSRGDARRVDFEDRRTQRLLSAEGEEQARRLGQILRRKEIPIGEVLTSPFFRTADSAMLTFGRAENRDALYGSRRGSARTELFTAVPTGGVNRVLMTHQGVLYSALPGVERGSIREGDCVVVEPDGRRARVIARLGPDEWEALR